MGNLYSSIKNDSKNVSSLSQQTKDLTVSKSSVKFLDYFKYVMYGSLKISFTLSCFWFILNVSVSLYCSWTLPIMRFLCFKSSLVVNGTFNLCFLELMNGLSNLILSMLEEARILIAAYQTCFLWLMWLPEFL